MRITIFQVDINIHSKTSNDFLLDGLFLIREVLALNLASGLQPGQVTGLFTGFDPPSVHVFRVCEETGVCGNSQEVEGSLIAPREPVKMIFSTIISLLKTL